MLASYVRLIHLPLLILKFLDFLNFLILLFLWNSGFEILGEKFPFYYAHIEKKISDKVNIIQKTVMWNSKH